MSNFSAQKGNSSSAILVLLIALGLIALGVWAAYTYGEGHISIDGRDISQLEPWEVLGGIVIGLLGLMLGLTLGLLGLLVGLIATVISLVLAFIGIAAGLFITAGVLLGPFLLIAAIYLLLRRRPQAAPASAVECDPATGICEIEQS